MAEASVVFDLDLVAESFEVSETLDAAEVSVVGDIEVATDGFEAAEPVEVLEVSVVVDADVAVDGAEALKAAEVSEASVVFDLEVPADACESFEYAEVSAVKSFDLYGAGDFGDGDAEAHVAAQLEVAFDHEAAAATQPCAAVDGEVTAVYIAGVCRDMDGARVGEHVDRAGVRRGGGEGGREARESEGTDEGEHDVGGRMHGWRSFK